MSPAPVRSLARHRAARLPPAERRAQLLACAIRVFARRGLGRAGHAEIAREAGVAVPTVFAYFRTREDLVRGVLAEISRRLHEMADRHYRDELPAPRALLDFAFAFAASVDEDPEAARVLLEWSAAVREDVWPLFLELYAAIHARIRATIERGRREQTIDGEIDAEYAALMIIGMAQLVVQMKFTRVAPEKLQRFLLTTLRGAIGDRGFAVATS